MIEHGITIDSNGSSLSATACVPESKGCVPAVLMIHGTGPMDRDENMKGQRLDVFNTIAHHLASVGIASLRYDKRGCGSSSGDYYRAGHTDLLSDAINCFDALTHLDFCEPDKAFVLGHSEGCIIAPQLSLQRPAVAGLLLLCPFVDPVESILMKQATQIQGEFYGLTGIGGLARRWLSRMMGMSAAGQQRLIDKLRSTDAEIMRSQFQKVPAKSLRELIDLDPRGIFARVRCPMLLIGGEKDLQCDPADVHRIAALATCSVTAHVIPNLTHVLRYDARQPSFLSTGQLLTKPMEPMVLDLIESWLTAQRGITRTANRVAGAITDPRPHTTGHTGP